MEWISVKDRLPEDGQRVIAHCQNTNKTFVGKFVSFGQNYWYHEGARGAKYCVTSKVTHWIPFTPPEPQKGE